jgi:hypothetical protein
LVRSLVNEQVSNLENGKKTFNKDYSSGSVHQVC